MAKKIKLVDLSLEIKEGLGRNLRLQKQAGGKQKLPMVLFQVNRSNLNKIGE